VELILNHRAVTYKAARSLFAKSCKDGTLIEIGRATLPAKLWPRVFYGSQIFISVHPSSSNSSARSSASATEKTRQVAAAAWECC
jgi:hypothetical protein